MDIRLPTSQNCRRDERWQQKETRFLNYKMSYKCNLCYQSSGDVMKYYVIDEKPRSKYSVNS